MDIKSLITPQALFSNRPAENALNLKVGQQLDVKVVNAEIQAAKNAITLTLGNKNISVQSNQPIELNPGRDLKIQVTQVAPVVEFKILAPLPELKNQTTELRLKLMATARDGGSVANSKELMRPTARDGGSVANGREAMRPDGATLSLSLRQPLDAKIIAIVGNKIQLQLVNSQNPQVALVNIDIKQLGHAPQGLKAGQNLSLEVVKTGAEPEFKVIAATGQPVSAKIIAINGDKIQLQLTNSPNPQAALVNIDIKQLSNAPQGLKAGQNLNLEVVKTGVEPEFKVIAASAQQVSAKIIAIVGNKIQLQLANSQNPQAALVNIDIKQLSHAPQGLKVGQNLNLEIIKTGAAPEFKVIPAAGQAIDAKIIAISGDKIQLQVFAGTEAGNKQASLINIDRSQLSNLTQALKVGQNLSLEIVKTGSTPEFKIIATANAIPEAQITEFVKQFLPRHEASPIFLNQLIKDLPQLMNNASVSQALKDISASIIRNLPPKEQLISSQGLKQSIANSGLFLEAKLSPNPAQAELIKELPELMKNDSVPKSLQRIAGEILQNLTQKEPLLKAPDTGNAQLFEAETAPPELKSASGADSLLDDAAAIADGLMDAKMHGTVAEDFKANLLKLIQALKQELAPQGEQKLHQADLDLLKHLQNKTENTVAKIVLDQLMSLPKDDSPKQLWNIDIPFIDRQQAETVKIEIQQDKDGSRRQSGSGDWSVNITVTPPELGTIHCIVSYRDNAINTYFKSQNPQTTELIKHNLDYLKSQLEEAGLTAGHMDAQSGSQKIQAPPQLAGKKLFDDKA